MFLLKILIYSCMTIYYIMEKIFLPLLFTSLRYRRHIKMSYERMLKKLMVKKKRIIMPKKPKKLNPKIIK